MNLLNRYIILERRLKNIENIAYIMHEDFYNRSKQWCNVYNNTKRKLKILYNLIEIHKKYEFNN